MNFPLWVLFLFGNSFFKKGFHKLAPSSLSSELVFLDGFFIIQGLKSALNQMPVMLLNAVERRHVAHVYLGQIILFKLQRSLGA